MQLLGSLSLLASAPRLPLLCAVAIGRLYPTLCLFYPNEPTAGAATHERRTHESGAEASTLLSALAEIDTIRWSDTSELVRAYLVLIQRLVGVRSALITQLNEATTTISAASDTDRDLLAGTIVPLEQSFCQYVQASGAPLAIPDTLRDARVADIAMRRALDIGAYLGVPIRSADGAICGVLCAVDPQPRAFSQAQIDFLRIVAGQLAFAAERQNSGRAEHQAEHTAKGLLRALDEQATRLRMVAHDIRTPLSSISGFAELMQQSAFGPVSQAQQNALDQIRHASSLIIRLADDLTDTLAIEMQTLTLLIEAFDPSVVALIVLEACRRQAAQRGLALELCRPGDLPYVVGDPARLQQVLFNLLSNALRYTVSGSVVLIIEIQQDMVEFRVEDTGPGIPAHDQEQIWKPYTRATTQGNGMGMGLYVVQRLIHAMGGSVGVRSVIGQGSAFWVRLPSQPRSQAVGDPSSEDAHQNHEQPD